MSRWTSGPIAFRCRTWHGVAIVAVSIVSTAAILAVVSDDEDDGGLTPAMEREYRSIQRCLQEELRHGGADRALRAC